MGRTLGIGEFARRCGLSVSALRFYDECGLLKPAEVDPANGYRFYEEAQLALALLVHELRALQLPLAEVRRLLDAPGAERHAAVEAQLEALENRLSAARNLSARVHRLIDDLEGTMTITVNGAELAAAIEPALAAVGVDPKRPALHGVLLHVKNGSLRVVATDSHRLVIRDLVGSGTSPEARAVVRAAGLDAARAWLAETTTVDVTLAPSVSLRGDGATRTLDTLDDEYPAYEDILETPQGSIAFVARDQLLDALDDLPEAKAVRFAVTATKIELSAEGEARVIDATTEGEPMVFHLNPRYAADAARAAVGPDLAIEVSSPVQPLVFRSADEGSAVTLLMPVKVG